ncbi:hypothetical protein ES703_09303 [subsurface metagenome]
MSCRSWFLIAISLFLFSFAFPCFVQEAYAWKNFDTNAAPYYARSWGEYNYDLDYGTHDWIADFAVDTIVSNPLLAVKWIDTNGNAFWSSRNKRIFLYATYGPDCSDVWFRTRHNQIIHGQGDQTHHHITFNKDTMERTGSWAADKADAFALAAIYALADGDCGTAAFFLGEMAHYISDMSCFFHVKRDGSLSNLHNLYEQRVLDRTLGRNNFLNQRSFLYSHREWFFDVDDLRTLYSFRTPGELATCMAYDAYFGTRVFGQRDQFWDYDFMKTCCVDIRYQLHRYEFWPEDKTWKEWDSNPGEYTPYNFIKRTEELLNHAITCVASALNWVVDQVQGFTCKPRGDEASADELYLSFAADLLFDGFFKVMTFIGVYASVYAIPLTSASKYLKGG